VLSAFSGVNLIALGWQGWLGILPIALVGKYTTQHTVKWSARNITEEEHVEQPQ